MMSSATTIAAVMQKEARLRTSLFCTRDRNIAEPPGSDSISCLEIEPSGRWSPAASPTTDVRERLLERWGRSRLFRFVIGVLNALGATVFGGVELMII
jgi:hypothetical protein